MAQRKDFVPTKDAEFDTFFKAYCRYVDAKCEGNPPEWTHIPAARRTDLNNACADWSAAYEKLAGPHTSSDVLAKKLARKKDEKILRDFTNEFILYSSAVSPQDEHPTPWALEIPHRRAPQDRRRPLLFGFNPEKEVPLRLFRGRPGQNRVFLPALRKQQRRRAGQRPLGPDNPRDHSLTGNAQFSR
jgi:hypothetical protein